jgi:hypothetical protein
MFAGAPADGKGFSIAIHLGDIVTLPILMLA